MRAGRAVGLGRRQARARRLAVLDLEPAERALGDERVGMRADACGATAKRHISATAESVSAPRARTRKSPSE